MIYFAWIYFAWRDELYESLILQTFRCFSIGTRITRPSNYLSSRWRSLNRTSIGPPACN
jgi:hypothetical protein